jgi:sarcosine oxidase subunit gamma
MAEGVVIEPMAGFGLASLLARKGVGAEAVAAALGVAPAAGPVWRGDAERSLIGVAPGGWLVLQHARTPDFIPALRRALGEAAYVADQSGAYLIWRIAGPGAQTLLQRGAPVDLHPDAFPPGAAASTVIAHIGVLLWRLEPPAGFAVAVFRSYEASFRHWLDLSTAAL